MDASRIRLGLVLTLTGDDSSQKLPAVGERLGHSSQLLGRWERETGRVDKIKAEREWLFQVFPTA